MKTQIESKLKSSHARDQQDCREFYNGTELEVQCDPDPEEFCICQNCKKRVKNPRSALHSNTQCPECGAYMISEWS